MFKLENFENEIYQSMEKKLTANQVEKSYGFNKLAKAADYLNAAAELFDNAGMYSEAKEITKILEELVNDL